MSDNLDPELRQFLADNVTRLQKLNIERDEATHAMKKLTSLLQTTRLSLNSYKEKSDMYELMVLRDGSHIKRLKKIISKKEREILNLKSARKSSEYGDDDLETDGVEPDVEKQTSTSKDGEPIISDVKPDASEFVYGISHEVYDQLLRDHIQLKKELENLIQAEKINPSKYMEDEERKVLITQLERSNSELKSQIRKLDKDLQDVTNIIKSDPRSNQSKVLDLSQQLKSLEDKYKRQEILLHCMEDKCQDLATKLLELKESRKDNVTPKEIEHSGAAFSATVAKCDNSESTVTVDQEVKDLRISNSALQSSLEKSHQRQKLLTEKLKSAEIKSQIFEQQYQSLLRAPKENKQVVDKCEKCSDMGKKNEELKKENEEQKQINGHQSAQLTVYIEDYNQSRLEITNLKKRNESEVSQWKLNYTKLSEELEKMKKALESQQQVNSRLRAENVRRRAPTVPEPYQQQSWADSSYQQPIIDVCDETQNSSSNRTRREAATAPYHSTTTELVCPRCKREFPQYQETEFNIHMGRCLHD
ncbi:uncharacterized protein [Antedon mediterranea]|uniref:uncharacterized protein n=1 Tax=Antedon mediterranea TaxID=105859 RepID=UPI003AF5D61F